MSKMNSIEIADELVRLGFALTVDNQHAKGYEHASMVGRIFVKTSKTGSPVGKQPLLIHPDHAVLSHWSAIKALSPSAPNTAYLNTNMTGFPRVNGSDSKQAIALDVAEVGDLHQLLRLFGLPVSAATNKSASEGFSAEDLRDVGLTDTERDALIKARIGQSDYRYALLAYWGGCAVTDCTIPALLRASHIKPWRAASAAERLDPYNGLLLTPNLDLAFDQGLISFDDNGQILLGSDLDPDSARALNLHSHLRLRQIEARHQGYLAWHRDNLFRK